MTFKSRKWGAKSLERMEVAVQKYLMPMRPLHRPLFLKHACSILRQSSMWFMVEPTQFSVGQTPHSLTCSIMEKPHTGLDDRPRMLQACFIRRIAAIASHVWKNMSIYWRMHESTASFPAPKTFQALDKSVSSIWLSTFDGCILILVNGERWIIFLWTNEC